MPDSTKFDPKAETPQPRVPDGLRRLRGLLRPLLLLGTALLLWPFCLGWGLAALSGPVAKRLPDRLPARWKRPAAVAYLTLLAGALAALGFCLLRTELPALFDALPGLRQTAQAALSRIFPGISASASAQTTPSRFFTTSSVPAAAGTAPDGFSGVLRAVLTQLPALSLQTALLLLLLIGTAALLLVPRLPRLYARLPKLQSVRTHAARSLHAPDRTLVIFISAVLLLSLLTARLLELPYPLLFALLLCVLELLPLVGAGWLLLPTAYAAALTAQQSVCLAAVTLYLSLLLLRVLSGRGKKRKPAIRHPLGMLITGYLGYRLLDLPGALLGAILGTLLSAPLLRLFNKPKPS